MLEFTLLKKSQRSHARLGLLKTAHGEVETPALVPVATQAVVKTLTSEEVEAAKSQLVIANTFHLHLKPGEQTIKAGGGLHAFMRWSRPLMTDSGGFQVFSLGFGRDFGLQKIMAPGAPQRRRSPVTRGKISAIASQLQQSENKTGRAAGSAHTVGGPGAAETIAVGQQPRFLKITEEGVWFRSPLDGRRIFIGPRESIKIQEALGADIVFAFDECTAPLADHAYTARSLERTHRWAKECLKLKTSRQALYGIVQGGHYKDLRVLSARFIAGLPFDGFGIGGEFGDEKRKMTQMLRWVIGELPEEKPRHLLGIGRLDDIPKIIAEGIDTFDCTVPTHYARHGVAFTSQGKLDLSKALFLNDKQPLDRRCNCTTCQTYGRNYLAHLIRAGELTALRLLTFHNLYFFNNVVEQIREAIKRGRC
ncbi:MAG: tRNA guanosine(34) transglycosylase Tgt [Patescibacteria group bacterium]|nr:tRNA guanosine(34) transglycosylase Tgt [Patescibacteria group bacterium]